MRVFLLIQSYWLEMRGSAVQTLRNLPDSVIAETSSPIIADPGVDSHEGAKISQAKSGLSAPQHAIA